MTAEDFTQNWLRDNQPEPIKCINCGKAQNFGQINSGMAIYCEKAPRGTSGCVFEFTFGGENTEYKKYASCSGAYASHVTASLQQKLERFKDSGCNWSLERGKLESLVASLTKERDDYRDRLSFVTEANVKAITVLREKADRAEARVESLTQELERERKRVTIGGDVFEANRNSHISHLKAEADYLIRAEKAEGRVESLEKALREAEDRSRKAIENAQAFGSATNWLSGLQEKALETNRLQIKAINAAAGALDEQARELVNLRRIIISERAQVIFYTERCYAYAEHRCLDVVVPDFNQQPEEVREKFIKKAVEELSITVQ